MIVFFYLPLDYSWFCVNNPQWFNLNYLWVVCLIMITSWFMITSWLHCMFNHNYMALDTWMFVIMCVIVRLPQQQQQQEAQQASFSRSLSTAKLYKLYILMMEAWAWAARPHQKLLSSLLGRHRPAECCTPFHSMPPQCSGPIHHAFSDCNWCPKHV